MDYTNLIISVSLGMLALLVFVSAVFIHFTSWKAYWIVVALSTIAVIGFNILRKYMG